MPAESNMTPEQLARWIEMAKSGQLALYLPRGGDPHAEVKRTEKYLARLNR